jgi:hypothetical protein
MSVQQGEVISVSVFCDMLEESELIKTTDLGCTVVHRVKHPEFGEIILVGSTGEQAGWFKL